MGQHRLPVAQPFGIDSVGAIDRLGHDLRSDHQIGADVLTSFEPFFQVVVPRFEGVDPADDSVLVAAKLDGSEIGRPGVVAQGSHRLLLPGRRRPADQKRGPDAVVAVAEHVGRDLHALADDALDGKTAAIDLRLDILDDDTAAALDGPQI